MKLDVTKFVPQMVLACRGKALSAISLVTSKTTASDLKQGVAFIVP
jgi:hypothetical protein